MATHDSTTSAKATVKRGGRPKASGDKKPGPQPLSPNGVDKELAHERARAPQRRARGARGRTVWAKRLKDLYAQLRRKRRQGKRLGGDDAGWVVRRRLRCVRYYLHWRTRLSEEQAARRAGERYACSSETVRRLVRLYRRGGVEALVPQPRGPRNPARRVAQEVEHLAVALRTLYGWNETRLAHELSQRGLARLSHTTVGHIFRRYHLPTRTYRSKARSDGLRYCRYEKSWPNAQWHIDFAQITLADGEVVLLVVVVDDYSRFCLACEVIETTSTQAVQMLFRALCRRYAVQPQEVVTDNGRAFVSVYADCEHVLTRFGLELQAHHTRHRHTSLYYPEGNGKAEALIKTLKSETLNRTFTTMDAVRTALAEFQDYYNFYRLHSSLGYLPPAVRYWGVEPPKNHGLAGLPSLPPEQLMAHPPHPSFEPYNTSPTVRRQMLSLVPISC